MPLPCPCFGAQVLREELVASIRGDGQEKMLHCSGGDAAAAAAAARLAAAVLAPHGEVDIVAGYATCRHFCARGDFVV